MYLLAALALPMLVVTPIPIFSGAPLYGYYASVPRVWGLTALEDERAGWVLMGLVDALAYGIAFFVVLGRMLAYDERSAEPRERIGARSGGPGQ